MANSAAAVQPDQVNLPPAAPQQRYVRRDGSDLLSSKVITLLKFWNYRKKDFFKTITFIVEISQKAFENLKQVSELTNLRSLTKTVSSSFDALDLMVSLETLYQTPMNWNNKLKAFINSADVLGKIAKVMDLLMKSNVVSVAQKYVPYFGIINGGSMVIGFPFKIYDAGSKIYNTWDQNDPRFKINQAIKTAKYTALLALGILITTASLAAFFPALATVTPGIAFFASSNISLFCSYATFILENHIGVYKAQDDGAN